MIPERERKVRVQYMLRGRKNPHPFFMNVVIDFKITPETADKKLAEKVCGTDNPSPNLLSQYIILGWSFFEESP